MPWLALFAAAFACEVPARTVDVVDAIGRAEVAWTALDADGFRRATGDARGALGCLEEAVGPDTAASVHELEGLAAFLDDDVVGARAHFGAVREILPAWQLAGALAPDGHPLRDLFDDAPATWERGPLPLPPGVAWVRVDGVRAADAPVERPYLLQRFGPDGAVLGTSMDEGLPVVAPVVGPDPHRRRRTAGVVVTTALAGIAIASFAGSAAASEHYWDPTTPPASLPGLQDTANGLTVAGGIAAAGAGTALAVTLVGGSR